MSLPAPTNDYTRGERTIAAAVACSAAFRQIVRSGCGSHVSPAERVYGDQVGIPFDGDAYTFEELNELGAYAQVVSGEEPYGKRRRATAIYESAGSTIVAVQRVIREDREDRDALGFEMKQLLGEFIDQLIANLEAMDRADGVGVLLQDVIVVGGPGFNDRSQQGQHGVWQGFELALTWGLGGGQ